MKEMYDIVTAVFEEKGLDPGKEIQGFAVPSQNYVTVTVPNLSQRLKDDEKLKHELIKGIATRAGIDAGNVTILF